MTCARHKDVETVLRCGRCGTPICPRCLVYTPVGARCPDCARVRRSPIYQVGARYFAQAVLAGLAVGVGGGLLLQALARAAGLFAFLVYVIYGGVMAEAVSWAANRKRGPVLQWIAAMAIVLGQGLTLVGAALAALAGRPTPLIVALLYVAIAVASAVSRLR